jgi:hypothetical protein
MTKPNGTYASLNIGVNTCELEKKSKLFQKLLPKSPDHFKVTFNITGKNIDSLISKNGCHKYSVVQDTFEKHLDNSY